MQGALKVHVQHAHTLQPNVAVLVSPHGMHAPSRRADRSSYALCARPGSSCKNPAPAPGAGGQAAHMRSCVWQAPQRAAAARECFPALICQPCERARAWRAVEPCAAVCAAAVCAAVCGRHQVAGSAGAQAGGATGARVSLQHAEHALVQRKCTAHIVICMNFVHVQVADDQIKQLL